MRGTLYTLAEAAAPVPGLLDAAPFTRALAGAIAARDAELHGHGARMAELAVRLAERLDLEPDEVATIRLGAILHDIGKIGIPDRVLLKPGPLDGEERALMRTHTIIGDRLLQRFGMYEEARPIVRYHHERWDGGGYPDGLAGEEIPLAARIVAVADAIEAMGAERVYSRALSQQEIVAELHACRGSAWDPTLVDLALELLAEDARAAVR